MSKKNQENNSNEAVGKRVVDRRKPGPVARFFGRPLGKFFTSLISTWLILGSISLFLLYGPWDGLRVFLITTAETTLNHKNISRLFYDMDTINEVMESNRWLSLILLPIRAPCR